jgi:transcriptional regulator with XRE-family HTH domain
MTPDSHDQPLTEQHHVQEEGPTPKPRINRLLRQARKERSWSQAELAEYVEVSKATISRWENGASKPQPYQLRKLCSVFEKPPEFLGYPIGHLEEASTEGNQPSPTQSGDGASHDGSAPPPVQEPPKHLDRHGLAILAPIRPVWSRRTVVGAAVLVALGLAGSTARVVWPHLGKQLLSVPPRGLITPPVLHWPTVGYDVHRYTERTRVVQYMLRARQYDIGLTGVDGVFGSYTEDAVRAFQGNQHLSVSGQVDDPTWEQLIIPSSIDNRGSQVIALQRCLWLLSFLPESGIDGDFGKNSAQAVRRFQQQQHLPQTSEADLTTWNLLVRLIPS